ncbi:DUF3592 domain-containing protein [Nocardioides ochotonae]|uniref:DUF3592 domain-containing protein n=1 Tax=Nocardioides ochotonae TaxID=2685869 RepID=UPI00140BCA5F|nr:hypothetical protein [Nocardioides ochotonae]
MASTRPDTSGPDGEKRRRRRDAPIVISLLGVLLGGAFGVWGLHGFATQPLPDRTVTGRHIESPCYRLVEYTVEGKTYRLDLGGNLGGRRCVAAYDGKPIEVSYEAAHPERAYGPGGAGVRWVMLVTGALGLLVAVATPLLAYRRRRPPSA